jgi:hypothetical protein
MSKSLTTHLYHIVLLAGSLAGWLAGGFRQS